MEWKEIPFKGRYWSRLLLAFCCITNNTVEALLKATYRYADTLLACSKLCRADQILWCVCFIEEAFHYMVHFHFIYIKETLTTNYCKPFNIYHV